MKTLMGCIAVLVIALAGCDIPRPNVTKAEATALLNSGKVTAIGVSHSGWTSLTIDDGTYRQHRAEIIGYPRQLLDRCLDCSNVSLWLE